MRDSIEANGQLLQYSAVETKLLPPGLLPSAAAGDAFDVSLSGAWAESKKPGAVSMGRAQMRAAQSPPRSGYCNVTVGGGASVCATADLGSFTMPENAGQMACFELCKRCERCRYISYSTHHRDCSWFSSCDLNRLHTEVPHFQTIATY